jgi:hypothetical protein
MALSDAVGSGPDFTIALLDRLPEPGIDPAQVTRLSGLIELADEAAVTLVGVTTAP